MYNWNQTHEYSEISIQLKPEIKSSDISITFGTKNIKIRIKDSTVLEGELEKDIYPDDSTWYITNEYNIRKLVCVLQKVDTKDLNGWWDRLFVTDEKMENNEKSRNIHEYSPEYQAKFHKMIYDMNQKMKNC
uniref:CS domain protein n=1 Tax=Pithovirus LCPAC302 TaxID=2506593 RepID=A0A481Z7N4_9VIRU|nr:MAG: CS domain protein [Pithovirus LCPAC302]